MRETKRSEIIEKVRQRIKEGALKDPARREPLQKDVAIAGPLLNELVELGYEIDTLGRL